MIPVYRYLEVGAYSMLNLMPFLLLAIYPFRRHLRFSRSATNGLIIAFMPVQMLLGCLAAFSPIGSAVPVFTAELKGDVGLSSAINSICILCSIVIMTVLLTVM